MVTVGVAGPNDPSLGAELCIFARDQVPKLLLVWKVDATQDDGNDLRCGNEQVSNLPTDNHICDAKDHHDRSIPKVTIAHEGLDKSHIHF